MEVNHEVSLIDKDFQPIPQSSLCSLPLGPQVGYESDEPSFVQMAESGDPRMDLWKWRVQKRFGEDYQGKISDADENGACWLVLEGFNVTKKYFANMSLDFSSREAAESFVNSVTKISMTSGSTTPI